MPKATKAQRDKLARIRAHYKQATESDQTNRRLAMEDMKFIHEPGAQWDQSVKSERGDRPAYEFNKLRVTVKRIVNDIRANRPQGKVRATEDSDREKAEVFEGLIRNVWNVSDGDTVIDQAAEYMVGAGMGAWRISVDYSDDSAFDQDVKIEAIRNPFCLYADPSAEDPMKRDARYWFLTTRVSHEAFEEKYGKENKVVNFFLSGHSRAPERKTNLERQVAWNYQSGVDRATAVASGIMAARTKPLVVKAPTGATAGSAPVSFSKPAGKSAVQMIDAHNLDALVKKLHEEAKVI